MKTVQYIHIHVGITNLEQIVGNEAHEQSKIGFLDSQKLHRAMDYPDAE